MPNTAQNPWPLTTLHALVAQRLNGAKSVTLQNSVGKQVAIQASEKHMRLTVTTKLSGAIHIVDDYFFFRPKFSRRESLIINISANVPSGVGHVPIDFPPRKALLEPDVIRGRRNAKLRRKWLPSILLLESMLSQRDYMPVHDAP